MPPELVEHLEKLRGRRNGGIYIERRFTAADRWKNVSIDEGYRFRGAFREFAPDLSEVLKHPRVVITGDPGLGKSTLAAVVARYLASQQPLMYIPILISLKSYQGSLRELVVKASGEPILALHEVGGSPVPRYFILDGLDEIPSEHLEAFTKDVTNLLEQEPKAGFLATARQAFYFENRRILSFPVSEFLMLEFSDEDIWKYASLAGVPDVKAFVSAVDESECEAEAGNPFMLRALVRRFLNSGKLGDRKSDNIEYLVDELIRSRPSVDAYRQRRALKMIAVAQETWCRNELSVEDARRILTEASQISGQEADGIVNELLGSILVRTSNGVAFQTRSFGEFLAADELANANLDRVRELAFLGGNKPHPSWQNTISYLAENNVSVRRYFAQNYPKWLLSSSPSAFSQDEKRAVTKGILTRLSDAEEYLLGHPGIKSFSLARFLTPDVAQTLLEDAASDIPHRKANALLLLGVTKDETIVPACLALATDTKRQDNLRYSALVALAHCGTRNEIDPLINALDSQDQLYINVADCVGSLAAEEDIERVLSVILLPNAMLSATFYRFREFKSREALMRVLSIAIAQPDILIRSYAEAYLGPVFKLLDVFWDPKIADKCGQLLLSMEIAGIYHRTGLTGTVISSITKQDAEGLAAQTYLQGLQSEGRRPLHLGQAVGPLVTPANARWLVEQHATGLIHYVAPYAQGAARDILSPHSEGIIAAQDETRQIYAAQAVAREAQRADLQARFRASRDLDQILALTEKLHKDYWPELEPEQQKWLAQALSERLSKLDLQNRIVWREQNQWTEPTELAGILDLVQRYQLKLPNDEPLVFSLKGWGQAATCAYFDKHGFTQKAASTFDSLISAADLPKPVISHLLEFLERTSYCSTRSQAALMAFAADAALPPYERAHAVRILANKSSENDTFVGLALGADDDVKRAAFEALIERQHRATIERGLHKLITDDEEFRRGEVQFPDESPHGWIFKIRQDYAWPKLVQLRAKALQLRLNSMAGLITNTMAQIDKALLATVVRDQILLAPPEWRPTQQTRALEYERDASLLAARQNTLDSVIRRLKGTTSMTTLKVWCEGPTDMPVIRRFLEQLVAANSVDVVFDFVGGWPNLLNKDPNRLLDGCREAVVIMDGDRGRKLSRRGKPLSEEGKKAGKLLSNLPIRLRILERYGIENYFTRTACEAVLGRDLSAYFPLPDYLSIEQHLVEWPNLLWRWFITALRRLIKGHILLRKHRFYRKDLNKSVANSMTLTDVEGTDLLQILREISERAQALRS